MNRLAELGSVSDFKQTRVLWASEALPSKPPADFKAGMLQSSEERVFPTRAHRSSEKKIKVNRDLVAYFNQETDRRINSLGCDPAEIREAV